MTTVDPHQFRMDTVYTDPAEAYVNHGRWLCDCVDPECFSAELLSPGEQVKACRNCHRLMLVTWPEEYARITRILWKRPVPQTRNWAPPGHRQAIYCGFPDGQCAEDLEQENAERGIH